jgi:YHS domain-containing protein
MSEQVKDIICGKAIEPYHAAVKTQYGGQQYLFCSEECRQAFERNPMDYVGDV